MTILVHDTLTRQKKPLEPVNAGQIGLYLCGPTVYDDCHIGHLMGPVLFDAITRWLRARGLDVRFVNNITDIDDKIIRRAEETGESWKAVAERYTELYFGYLRDLAVTTITDHPRCTDYVEPMIAFCEDLVARDRAYVASDGLYYRVNRQEGYGKLSGRSVEEMQAGARVGAAAGLEHPADFALWKLSKPGEPSWPSPYGDGRPGWHLECSVMSSELLGTEFDIHGGGDDLKFPHHENEIAQSEACGHRYARTWMHTGLVQYGGKKVAKSDPRMQDPEFSQQFQARWLIDTYGAPTIRYFLLRGHYRRPVDFEPKNVEGARKGLLRFLDRLGEIVEEAHEPSLQEVCETPLPDELVELRSKFLAGMDDDFGTGEAIAVLFSMQKASGSLEGDARVHADRCMRDLGRLLGLFQPGDRQKVVEAGRSGDDRAKPVVEAVIQMRQAARESKDFARSDALRDLLQQSGVTVNDAAQASEVEVGADVLGPLMAGLLELRAKARVEKDFATADALRDALDGAGVEITDGPDGAQWAIR